MKRSALTLCPLLFLVLGLTTGGFVGWSVAGVTDNSSSADASELLRGLETGAIKKGDTLGNQYVVKPVAFAELTEIGPDGSKHTFWHYLFHSHGHYVSLYRIDDTLFAAHQIDCSGDEHWFFFDEPLFDRYLAVSMPHPKPESVEE